MTALSGVRAYFGFQFFFSLLLWAPIFYEYQRRTGLSDAQIFAIQSLYYLVFCLLEIPTGALADALGYRRCIRWGARILVVANLLPIFAANFAGFAVHWVLIALSRSLISGAASAYLYEYLRFHGEPEGFKLAEGRSRALGLSGKVVGWAAIGYLMEWHFTLPYWLTVLSAGCSVWYASRLPALDIEQHARRPGLDFRAAFGLLRRSRALLLAVISGLALFVLARLCQVNLYQPILNEKGLGLGAAGVIMAVTTLFEAAGSACPNLLRRICNDFQAVLLLTVAMAVSTSGMAWSGASGTIAWLCVFALAVGLSYPIQRQLLNDLIPDSRYRATVMSLESLIDRAAVAALAPALAGFVAGGTLDLFLHGAALLSLLLTAALALAGRGTSALER